MKSIRKLVVTDCAKAITPALIFNIFYVVLTSVLTVYTATIASQFTDAVFRLDFSYGLSNFLYLIYCLLISLLILPIFGVIKEVLLFSKSLKHNRIIYSRFLSKAYKESQKFSEGEIQYRLEDDAIDFRCMWLDLVTKYVSIPVTFTYLLYNCIRINVLYTTILLLLSALKFVVPIVTRRINAKFDKESREYNTKVRAQEIEIMRQPHKIKLFGLTEPLIEKVNKAYFTYFKEVFRKAIVFSTIAGNISSTLDSFCTITILLVGSLLIVNGSVSAGAVIAIFAFYSVLNSVVSDVASIIKDTPILKTLIDRLSVFYEGIEDESKRNISFVFSNEIEVKNLSFFYEEKKILSDVSFSIKKGEKIAVCGHNGCGKTTLISLLCGFLKGYSGEIRVDGKNLQDICTNNWYDNIAFVEQDPYLFSTSVRENIRLGNLDSSDETINNVCKELELDALINEDVSISNNELSGGEKQKIAIARALLKDAPIILMDEPSNNLDSKTVSWLQSFIIKTSKTIVFISHDPNLISCSDKIISL